MRADRLVALLMLLQRRGSVTAAEAAEELEVSVRTARRDFEALSGAGVPVYPQPGRGGGWRLLGGASTDLSGLTAPEARALFVNAGRAFDEHPQLQAALRKLAAALPAPFQADVDTVAESIRYDQSSWAGGDQGPAPPFLDVVTDAVVDGVRLRIDYQSPTSGTSSNREISPLGLVNKSGIWYLVAMTDAGRRTFRLDRMVAVTATDAPADRPERFSLDQEWIEVVGQVQAMRLPATATARVRPDLVWPVQWQFGAGCTVNETEDDGHVIVNLSAHSNLVMAYLLAGFGAGVQVLSCADETITHLRRITAELQGTYGDGAPVAGG